jgi:hypothetical protein
MGDRQGWGRWRVRLCASLGVVVIALSAVGWWLSTRVLDSEGFAEVVTLSSQRREVRDYIADQATLRLATTSNFVSAARPVVTDAISQAIASAPVREAVHDFALLAHSQIERFSQSKRVNVSSAEAANTVRVVLDAASPSLARKLPPNVLSATTTISQSETVDFLFRVGRWVRYLYIPALLVGIGILAYTLHRARDRVHAIRAVGVMLAVGGALLMGIGASTPAFAAAAETNAPGRGDAVAQFIDVLVGRLYGAGKAMGVLGLLIALAPGHDGGDLAARAERLRNWIGAKRLSRAWRFAGGLVLAGIALWALTDWNGLFDVIVAVAGLLLLYVAVVICLRATGLLVTDHSIPRLHVRQVAAVFAMLVVAFLVTGTAAVAIVARNTDEVRANPTNQGCNGFIELCTQTVDSIVWAGSHNAMSSSAYDFFGAEHTITVGEQLNSGIRFLMLDAYYGYDDNGLVRTNLAGAVDRTELRADRGESAVRELDRLGALTGAVDTSGKRNDVYFCHDFCELGAVPASRVLGEIRDFLDRNLTDVVIIDVEDYVKPKDFEQALREAELLDRVFIPKAKDADWPSLVEMVATKDQRHGKKRRLVVMFEKQKAKYPWLLNTYAVSEETPFSFRSASAFDCAPNRGETGKSLLIVNHWINPGGLPDPVRAGVTNSQKVLKRRMGQCITERNHLPNVVAVNFTVSGDLVRTVNRYNAAVARATRVTRVINTAIEELRATKLSRADRRDLDALKRLPKISAADAATLLGQVGPALPSFPRGLELIVRDPEGVDRLADSNDDDTGG